MNSMDVLAPLTLAWVLVGMPIMLWLTSREGYTSTTRGAFAFLSLFIPFIGWVILAAVMFSSASRRIIAADAEQPGSQHT